MPRLPFLRKRASMFDDTRICPVCRGRVEPNEPLVHARGMRFHSRCAGYRMRTARARAR